MKKLHHFISPVDLSGEVVEVADTKLVHHLKEVLRLAAGEEVVIGDGKGVEAKIMIDGFDGGILHGTVVERLESQPEKAEVILCVATLKRDSFETVVQKAAELGVYRIIPLHTERTVKLGFNRERLVRIMTEAAEQSEQSRVPELSDPVTLPEALDETVGAQYFFVREGVSVAHEKVMAPRAALFIGPEGGWSEAEEELAQSKGCKLMSLGSTMLRAETAALTAAFWALTFRG